MKSSWKKISSRVIYKNAWLKLREDKVVRPDGKNGIYGVVEFPPASFIVAFRANKDILLLNLFRYNWKEFMGNSIWWDRWPESSQGCKKGTYGRSGDCS